MKTKMMLAIPILAILLMPTIDRAIKLLLLEMTVSLESIELSTGETM